MMKVRIGVIALAVVVAAGVSLTFGDSGPRLSLAEKIAQADAIVVGKVAEIETKRYSLTLFERDSEGKQPRMTTFYNLAVLHPETIIKADSDSMVNKADKSNPVAWMHMAYQMPGQKGTFPSLYPSARKGERRIWFLRRDIIFTGHYFIREAEVVTDAKIEEIKQLMADKRGEKP